MLGKIVNKVKLYLKDAEERHLLNQILWTFLIKGLSLMISTFSMPMYIRYFNNNDVLGAWYTVLSLLSWIMMCDLGLGNGLRNSVTIYMAEKKYDEARTYISSTYIALITIVTPIVLTLMLLIPRVNVNAILNISTEIINQDVLTQATLVLVCGICVNFVLKTINSILYAIQLSSLNNAISLLCSSLPLLFMAVYKGTNIEQNLLSLSWVHVISINLPLLIASVIVFTRPVLKKCRPSIRSFNMKSAKSSFQVGMQFFAAQIFFMFLMSTNELFITRLYASNEVVKYNIYYRLFMMIGSLFMVALTPLWSKVTKDLAEKKYNKLKMTNRILYLIAAIASVAEFTLVLVLQFVVNIWLGDEAIIVNNGIAFVFAIFGSLYLLNIVLTTVANGMGELKTQMIFYGIGSVFKIPAAILLQKMGISWVGIVLYNSTVLLGFCIFQYVWVTRKINQLLKEERDK